MPAKPWEEHGVLDYDRICVLQQPAACAARGVDQLEPCLPSLLVARFAGHESSDDAVRRSAENRPRNRIFPRDEGRLGQGENRQIRLLAGHERAEERVEPERAGAPSVASSSASAAVSASGRSSRARAPTIAVRISSNMSNEGVDAGLSVAMHTRIPPRATP